MADHIAIDFHDDTDLLPGDWVQVPVIGSADRWAKVERVERVSDGVTHILAAFGVPPMAALVG